MPIHPRLFATPLASLLAAPALATEQVPVTQISAGDTAWMLSATALVLLMTLPGLALFYAGMVRKKNILAVMAQTLACAALVSLLWAVCGYSLAFEPGAPGWERWIGGLGSAGLGNVLHDKAAGTVAVHALMPSVPAAAFVLFQLSFAVITPCLIIGAVAERMRFAALLAFLGLWSLCVYVPVAHWVWAPQGWLSQLGALDFAGGTVVHINAGVAGLVAAWMLGPRQGFGRAPLTPANLAYTMTGAGLLWVGWMGFNGGSAGAADGRAGIAMLNTQLGAAAAAMSWMATEWVTRRTPTLLGLCSGAVAGLVAITPACGFVTPGSAAFIGLVAGAACFWGATGLKRWLRADDSLDVFGVHGVGGIVGALLTGVLADPRVGGVAGSLGTQALAVVATLAFSAGMTAGILLLVYLMLGGLRVDAAREQQGLDLSQHGEQVA
ncbi:ammonium transporter [Roseateles sp. BYS78W]|uniref:Ammonium transporter n=1 Tax=Pelomonas candidula TaxID=3299025 RepID=A0ABW7H6X6_9BURK